MHFDSIRNTGVHVAVAAGLVGVLMFSGSVPAFADTQSDLAAAQEQLVQIGKEYQELQNSLQDASSQLEITKGKIDETNAKLSTAQATLSQTTSFDYKTGGAKLSTVVLGAANFNELFSRVLYMNKVSDAQAEAIENVKELKTQLNAQQEDQAKRLEETQQQVDAAAENQKQAQELVNSLSAEVKAELEAKAAADAALAAGLQSSNDADNAPAGGSVTGGQNVQDAVHDTTTNAPATNTNGTQQQPAQPQPAPAPAPDSGSVVQRAYSQIGKPYVYGAVGPNAFDCSGFVSYCLTGSYTRLGSTYTFMGWTRVNDPQPGDVCTNWGHCGIYIGNGQMIHASRPGVGVIIGPVQSGMVFVRR